MDLNLPKKRVFKTQASTWKRVVAYFIDTIIIGIVVESSFSPILGQIYEPLKKFSIIEIVSASSTGKSFLIFFIISILTLGYWSVLEYKLNQTIGKLLLNLYTVPDKGKKLTFHQAFTRNISKISTVILILDCIPLLNRKNNKRYLEKVSKTRVIDVREV